jgi:hypothetical protein
MPSTPAETVELAWVCSTPRQKEYALAVRLYTDAFAADPRLLTPTGIHRYNAACATVRLAAGDDPGALVGDEEAGRLRNQAREWLAGTLAALRPLAKSAQPATRRLAADRLSQWGGDPDLGSVRDPRRRAGLPEEERKAWEEFWAEVGVARKSATLLPGPPAGP